MSYPVETDKYGQAIPPRVLKPQRVIEIEKEALLKKPCEKIGAWSEGYRDHEIWACELADETMILVEHGYSHVSARHWTSEIWISEDLRRKASEVLKV